jgi:hypothetical protein
MRDRLQKLPPRLHELPRVVPQEPALAHQRRAHLRVQARAQRRKQARPHLLAQLGDAADAARFDHALRIIHRDPQRPSDVRGPRRKVGAQRGRPDKRSGSDELLDSRLDPFPDARDPRQRLTPGHKIARTLRELPQAARRVAVRLDLEAVLALVAQELRQLDQLRGDFVVGERHLPPRAASHLRAGR